MGVFEAVPKRSVCFSVKGAAVWAQSLHLEPSLHGITLDFCKYMAKKRKPARTSYGCRGHLRI
jgi:hypothetical protein